MGDYEIDSIYQGGYSSFKPEAVEGMNAGTFGMTTDPRVGNILQEVSSKLSSGIKHMEIEFVSPDMLDQVPKQQMEEIYRLKKLTGIDVSVHGPVIDTTGISQNGFSELNREASERKIFETLRRSQELDPKGNIKVNFHSAEGIPGSEWKVIGDEEKKIKSEARRLILVNKETGKLAPMEEERKHLPGEEDLEKGHILSPQKRLSDLNVTEWDNSLSQLIFNKERADEILKKNASIIQPLINEKGKLDFSDKTIKESPEAWNAAMHMNTAAEYLNDTYQHIANLFDKAYKYGSKEQREVLKNISEKYKEPLKKYQTNPLELSKIYQELILNMKQHELAPEMYVPVEKFAAEQSAKTFGNAAFEAYDEFNDKAPVLLIENPPAGFALSTGEDLRKVVEESRKRFVDKAVESGKLSKSEAEKQAEKLIGATWDVGHINMIRKQGFEEEDVIKETEKIAPYVKHVHLSDNFGFEHTELPMGMGNVPIKEIMKKLGKEGYESKKIIEAAHWWQHFKTSPLQPTMELMGSPIYSEGVGPYWNQNIGLQQGYFGGMGMMLPQINYETFGAGFSQLPAELGGQRGGGGQGSRMSGRGME